MEPGNAVRSIHKGCPNGSFVKSTFLRRHTCKTKQANLSGILAVKQPLMNPFSELHEFTARTCWGDLKSAHIYSHGNIDLYSPGFITSNLAWQKQFHCRS